ncbi:MAG: hypothetical protein EPN26_08535 [Rhodospirillales bacterium]|nr:MAG: hypothetical protein EPN26_08535 [Rhodospirillales bacterium]
MRFLEWLSAWAEALSRRIGDAASWLLLAVAAAGVAVFLLRHLLGFGEVALPPAYVWCTGLVMLAGAGMALKSGSQRILLFHFLPPRLQSIAMAIGALFVLLPWAVLLDLFAGSLSAMAPSLIGQASGTLESPWWRLAVDVGAVAMGLEGIGLAAQGIAGILKSSQGGGG